MRDRGLAVWSIVFLSALLLSCSTDDKPTDAGTSEGGRAAAGGGARAQGGNGGASAGREAIAIDAGASSHDEDAGEPLPDSGQALPGGDPPLSARYCTPGARSFLAAIGESGWHDVTLSPAGGMAALLAELERLRSEDLTRPVRVRLSAGFYAATDVGRGEIYVKDLNRSAQAPVLVQAIDPRANATRLGQGLNLVGVSYLAFDGLTIGPDHVGAFHGTAGMCDEPGSCYHDEPKPLSAEAGIHVSGTAIAPAAQGLHDAHLDYAVFGRYAPSHHILVQNMTIQNIFGDDEPSGPLAAGGGSDGIKFNQAAYIWVMHNRVRQTSRHVVDNVAVHGACYLGNVLADQGQGLGIEAKGGSADVTFDGNVLVNVRRLELGGENTDAVYYWSAEDPGSVEHYAYEGRRVIARNNIVIDAREGALEFSGCHDCAAVGNTILFRVGFDTSFGGGDAVREVDSHINREGAGTDCTPLDGDGVENCWGVGPYPADLVAMPGDPGDSRILDNRRNSLSNNLFVSLPAAWGSELNPYNHPNPEHSFGFGAVDYDYWYNGGSAMPDPGDGSWLQEGAHSTYTGETANADPQLGASLGAIDVSSETFLDELQEALRPLGPQSPLVGHGSADVAGYTAFDNAGAPRPGSPTIGALEP